MKPLKLLFTVALTFALGLLAVQAFAELTPSHKAKPPATKADPSKPSKTPAAAATDEKPADRVQWVSFDKGVQLQKGNGKHLFIDFTTTWCGWCKKMEAETFSDTAVAHYINKNFVPVKVWADQDSVLDIDGYKVTQKQLAQSEFQVSGYPTFWFLNTKKEKLGPVSGYRTKEQLMDILPVVAEYRYDSTRAKTNTAPQPPTQGK
jgi:thioredoxin-related protein